MKNYNKLIKELRELNQSEINRFECLMNRIIEVDKLNNTVLYTNRFKGREIDHLKLLQKKLFTNTEKIARLMNEYIKNECGYNTNFIKSYYDNNIVYVELEQSNIEIKVQFDSFFIIIKDKYTDKIFFKHVFKRYYTVTSFINKELNKPIPQKPQETDKVEYFKMKLKYPTDKDISNVTKAIQEMFEVKSVTDIKENKKNESYFTLELKLK